MSWKKEILFFVMFNVGLSVFATESQQKILIEGGSYQSFFKELKQIELMVPTFYLNKYPVTVKNFNEFLATHPNLQKSKILSLYADERYLENWKSDLLTATELKSTGQQPITTVSWFAARRYCEAQGGRLPTIAEWEYAADAKNPKIIELLLAWYAKTNDPSLKNVGLHAPNKMGLYDMHGLIWEMVEDFNSVMISTDSRTKGGRTDGQFCGGGSVNAEDSTAYATFMRYAFRSGMHGNYCLNTLGFRCAFNK